MNVPLQVRQSLIMAKHFVLSIASGSSASVDRPLWRWGMLLLGNTTTGCKLELDKQSLQCITSQCCFAAH